MSADHADTIRRYIEATPRKRSRKERPDVLDALDALVAENQQLRDALEAADVQVSAIHDKLYVLYADSPGLDPDLAVNAEVWKAHNILRGALAAADKETPA